MYANSKAGNQARAGSGTARKRASNNVGKQVSKQIPTMLGTKETLKQLRCKKVSKHFCKLQASVQLRNERRKQTSCMVFATNKASEQQSTRMLVNQKVWSTQAKRKELIKKEGEKVTKQNSARMLATKETRIQANLMQEWMRLMCDKASKQVATN